MISLNVYLTPKTDKVKELESVIHDQWIAAMATQPGFLRAALLKPFPDEDLITLDAIKPQHVYEVVAYWETEKQRVDWTQKPIHEKVWTAVLDASENVTYTVQTIEQSWNV